MVYHKRVKRVLITLSLAFLFLLSFSSTGYSQSTSCSIPPPSQIDEGVPFRVTVSILDKPSGLIGVRLFVHNLRDKYQETTDTSAIFFITDSDTKDLKAGIYTMKAEITSTKLSRIISCTQSVVINQKTNPQDPGSSSNPGSAAEQGSKSTPGIEVTIEPRKTDYKCTANCNTPNEKGEFFEHLFTGSKPGYSQNWREEINEDDTRRINIEFSYLNPNKDYIICTQSDESKCPHNVLPSVTTELFIDRARTAGGEVKIVVCGGGQSSVDYHFAVEGNDDRNDCSDKRFQKVQDFFHGGHTYHVRLYEYSGKAKQFPVSRAHAVFYMNHYYPNVYINNKIIASTDEKLIKQAYILDFQNKTEATKGFFEIPLQTDYEGFPIFTVGITGRRPGGERRNNYQIIAEGLNSQHKEERCRKVVNDSEDSQKSMSSEAKFGVRDNPDQKLDIGNYLLKVNEQVDESIGKKAFGDNCTGGFTHWHIPFTIERATDTQGNILNSFIMKIDSREIERDPHESDLGKRQRDTEKRKPPCVEGKLNPRTKLCKEVDTAIGRINVETPEKFIGTIFSIILSIAGVAAVVLLLVAGYQIMLSSGDKQKIQAARETISSTLIGLIFIILSLVILQVIGVDILRIPGFK